MKMPKINERWSDPQGGSWLVVIVTEDCVKLSGPGPCRMYREVNLKDFLIGWAST